jgi:hypothetical protein
VLGLRTTDAAVRESAWHLTAPSHDALWAAFRLQFPTLKVESLAWRETTCSSSNSSFRDWAG